MSVPGDPRARGQSWAEQLGTVLLLCAGCKQCGPPPSWCYLLTARSPAVRARQRGKQQRSAHTVSRVGRGGRAGETVKQNEAGELDLRKSAQNGSLCQFILTSRQLQIHEGRSAPLPPTAGGKPTPTLRVPSLRCRNQVLSPAICANRPSKDLPSCMTRRPGHPAGPSRHRNTILRLLCYLSLPQQETLSA